MKVNSLKKIPQRRARRCSCTPASRVFSSNFQLLSSPPAAADAFRAAMGKTYVDTPDLFGGMAEAARTRADGYAEAAGMLSEAASRPMTAWAALKAAIFGAGAAGLIAQGG